MISDKLADKVLFQWREDRDPFDREAKMVIDRGVRRVVMLMRAFETHGYGTREDIEEAVLQAFERAEYLYYGLDEHEIMSVIKMEGRNEKGRRKHS